MSSTTGPSVGRLEVFSMGFNILDSTNNSSNIEDSSVRTDDLVDLKQRARIFFVGEEQFIELHNSKIADSLFSDVPIQQEMRISDFYKQIFQEEIEISDFSQKGSKQIIQEEIEIPDFSQKSSKQIIQEEMKVSDSSRKSSKQIIQEALKMASQKSSKQNILEVMKVSDFSQKSSKQKMVDYLFKFSRFFLGIFSGGSDVSEASRNRAKRHGKALMRDEEEEEMLVADRFRNKSNYSLDLPLTGPADGMIVDDFFSIVIHKDTGNPSEDDGYENLAAPFYIKAEEGVAWGDNATGWIATTPDCYDEVANFYYTNYEYRTLRLEYIMEYIVYRDSKAVDVYVLWCLPDSHICGKITVSNDKFADKESVLIQTPQNKAIHAKNGELLKLSRFVVALPYDSGFTVKARLHDPNNRFLVVNESVNFPFKPFYKPVYSEGPENYLYRDKNIIEGIIEVRVTVYV